MSLLNGKSSFSGTVALSSNSTTTVLTSHIDESVSDPLLAIGIGTVARMTTNIYDVTGNNVSETRNYFLVPGSGAGSAGTNYDKTTFVYDDAGRRTRSKQADGTIARSIYDLHNRVTESWSGTNDHNYAGGEVSGPDNMVKVQSRVIDSGSDGGNGYLTSATSFVEGSSTGQRVTTFTNDLRGRAVLVTNPTTPHSVTLYDNLGRAKATGLYSSASGLTASSDPTATATNRMALSETSFDERGQVFKSTRHKIDPSDGSDDDTLTSQTWYDAKGRAVKTVGGDVSKTTYDRLGRVTDRHTLAKDTDASYSDSVAIRTNTSTGDIVISQNSTYFDSNGDATLHWGASRHHNDAGGGETAGLLDTGADNDRTTVTSGNLKGRSHISSHFYDSPLHRLTDVADSGNFNGSTFGRGSDASTTRSDTNVVTSYVYNDDGTTQKITDPDGFVTYFVYDAMGRKTKEVHNYNSGVNSGNPSGTADNQTVTYAYSNGHMTTMTTVMPSGGTDQVNTYTYGGFTVGSSVGNSKIPSGSMLRTVAYPDTSGGSDVVTYAYNAQGQMIYKEDQAGNELEFVYDDSGRESYRKATTVASGFDSSIRRIGRTYDDLGRPSLVTQYSDTAGTSVTDQTQYNYSDWGPISSFKIDRDSAIGGGGNEYTVSYTYDKATSGRQSVRRATQTMPSGKIIGFNYASSTSHDDDLSRVTFIVYDTAGPNVRICTYKYNDLNQVVGTIYDEANVFNKQFDPASPQSYTDLDRFGRVSTSKWTKDLASDVDFYKVNLSYDRNSNITWVEDKVHTGFDVKYDIDNLNRVTKADEGTRSGSSITSRKREQEWTLSHTGNWDVSKLDLNGNLNYTDSGEYNDTRVHNAANELLTRDTDSNSSVNYTQVHDAAGNMTDDGKDYKYVYDPFGRLMTINNQSNVLVAEYKYNGLGYRIAFHEDANNSGTVDGSDNWFYIMYDESWRTLAVFLGSDTTPKEEFINHNAGLDGFGGSSMLDGVICRTRDANTAWNTTTDGVMEERLYTCQNWRGDVSAIVTSDGKMKEWIKYSAYGIPFALPAGDTDSDGDCDSTDVGQILTWKNAGHYDVRGDLDLDGDVDATDRSTAIANFQGTTLGWGVLSNVGNRKGFAGYERDINISNLWHVRNRVYNSELGRWTRRDPAEYSESISIYEYVQSCALLKIDPHGLQGSESQPSHTADTPFQIGVSVGDLVPATPLNPQGLPLVEVPWVSGKSPENQTPFNVFFAKNSPIPCGTIHHEMAPAILYSIVEGCIGAGAVGNCSPETAEENFAKAVKPVFYFGCSDCPVFINPEAWTTPQEPTKCARFAMAWINFLRVNSMANVTPGGRFTGFYRVVATVEAKYGCLSCGETPVLGPIGGLVVGND